MNTVPVAFTTCEESDEGLEDEGGPDFCQTRGIAVGRDKRSAFLESCILLIRRERGFADAIFVH